MEADALAHDITNMMLAQFFPGVLEADQPQPLDPHPLDDRHHPPQPDTAAAAAASAAASLPGGPPPLLSGAFGLSAAAAARLRISSGSFEGFFDSGSGAANPAFIIEGEQDEPQVVTPLTTPRTAAQPAPAVGHTAAAPLALDAAGFLLPPAPALVIPPLFVGMGAGAGGHTQALITTQLHPAPLIMAPPAAQEAPGDIPDGSRPGRRAAAAAARQRLQGWTGALAAPEGSSSGEGRGSSSGAMSGGGAGSKGSGKTSQGRGSGGSSGAKHKGSPPRKRQRAEDDADYTEDGSSGEATSSGGRGGGGAARAAAGAAGGGGGAARPAGKVVLRPKGFKADRGASSELKGVSRHKNTGKFEAHLWDGSFMRGREAKRQRGRQIYLGSFDTEVAAARTYDVAALLFLRPDAPINFKPSDYDLTALAALSREEVLRELRRSGAPLRATATAECGDLLQGL